MPLVSIIIPTYNSEENLKILLESFINSENKNFELIINDDRRTNDNTPKLIKVYSNILRIKYIQKNILMSQARKLWAEYANWEILFHMDSDMKVTPWLIWEIIELMNIFDALIINEESYGNTFWAKCKWLEKKCFTWVREIESLRVIKKEKYNTLWWHDEKMIFSEDKDLDIRAQKAWYKIWRLKNNFIWHNEWDLKLFKTLKKKKWYSWTANIFAKKHPKEYRWQINIFNRYFIYLKNIKYLLIHPLLYLWMVYMKTMEFWSWAMWLLFSKR